MAERSKAPDSSYKKSSFGQPRAYSGQETGGGSNPPLVNIQFFFGAFYVLLCPSFYLSPALQRAALLAVP
jgi:hypothetical protein